MIPRPIRRKESGRQLPFGLFINRQSLLPLTMTSSFFTSLLLFGIGSGLAGAEVLFEWTPDTAHIKEGSLSAITGPAGTLAETAVLDAEGLLEFDQNQHIEFPTEAAAKVPTNAFSVEATVRIDQPQQWGSIITESQDNGSYERGWLLGYNGDRFSFRISTGGTLGGATSNRAFSPGQWAHLVGVFDGSSVRLYIDGVLAASQPMKGEVVRPDIPTPFVMGAYKDKDEFFPIRGRIKLVRIHDTALDAKEIAKSAPRAFPFTVRPSLRYLSPSSAEVLWESSEAGQGLVAFGPGKDLSRTAESDSDGTRHQVILDNLLPNTLYHYRIAARTPDGLVSGKVETFDTALNEIPPDFADAIPPSPDPLVRNHAREAAEKIGPARGFCLVLGLTDGKLLGELARVSNLTIVGVDSNPTRIAALRKSIQAEGLYGHRITIIAVEDMESLPFSSCLANLVVSEQTLHGGRSPCSTTELHRILRPGGLALLADKTGSAGHEFLRPPLEDSGDWSHQYGNPANTAATGDSLSGANSTSDFSLQWLGRPGADFGIDRQPRMPAPLAVNGRLFHQGMNRMVALDAYNGHVLWAMEVPDLRRLNMPHDCGNWCADADNLFVAIGDRAWAMDAATGERAQTFRLTAQQRGSHDWGFIACTDNQLFGSSVPVGAQFKDFWGGAMWYDKAGDPSATAVVCSDNVFSYDKDSANGLWAYGRGLIINSTITIAKNRMWFVESRPPEEERPSEGRISGNALWLHAHIVCLDTRTGDVIWDQEVPTPDTLKHGSGHLVDFGLDKGYVQAAYGAYTEKGFLLVQSVGRTNETGQAAGGGIYNYLLFDDVRGKLDWHQGTPWRTDNHGGHIAHPVVLKDRVYIEPGGVSLSTGKVLDHQFGPRIGCATVVAGRDSLFFRGIGGAITQWSLDSRTPSAWSRLRPSCWLNFVPAQGMMLIPEGGAGCSCGGWMETSLGLIPNALLEKK